MPKELITSTFIDNGPEGHFDSILRVSWGAKGDAPEAPDGWVNAGFAHLELARETDRGSELAGWVVLDAAAMDHLIRVLKRVRRKTFKADPDRALLTELRNRAFTDVAVDHQLKQLGLG